MTADSPQSPRSIHPLLVLAVLFGVGFLVFGGGLGGPFVYDDNETIVHNESLESFGTALFPPKDTSFAGRPTANVSMWLDKVLFGLEDPTHVHRTNLILHVLCVFLLGRLLAQVLAGPRIGRPDLSAPVAIGAGLLALVHPLNAEVVYYASPRTETLLVAFLAGSLLCLLRRIETKSTGWLVAMIVLAWGGAFSKEVMVITPLIVFLFLAAYFAEGFVDAWAKYKLELLAFSSCVLPAIGIMLTKPRTLSVGTHLAGGPIDYLKSQCLVLPAYLRRLFWPDDLIFDYGFLLPVSWSEAAPGFAFLGIAFLVACWLMWSRPALGFPALFTFLILAPSSSLMPIVTEIGADRRVYLPVFAFLATVVFIASRWRGGWVALGLAVFLAVPLGLVSRARGGDYATRLALWESVVEACPENPRAWYNVAECHMDAGDVLAAQPAIATAAELFEGDVNVRMNHGAVLSQLGRLDEALIEFEAADFWEPSDRAKDAQLRTLVGLGRADEARRRLREWSPSESLKRTALEIGLYGQ